MKLELNHHQALVLSRLLQIYFYGELGGTIGNVQTYEDNSKMSWDDEADGKPIEIEIPDK